METGNNPHGKLPGHDLLTSAEVTAYFRIQYRTLMRWIRKQLLTPVKQGGILYFRKEEIEQIGRMGEQEAAAEE